MTAAASSVEAATAQPAASAAPIVRVSGLGKRYGADIVLGQVTLAIQPREFVAITGPSGSGKSTLLNVIGALDDLYEGTVELAGKNLRTLSDRARSQLRAETVGFVFQAFNLLDHLTCLENVLLPTYFLAAGSRGAEHNDTAMTKRAKDVLERVGLAGKLDEHPPRLSGGQKQRVAIARALCNRPPLLLCDEPTGNLDARTGAQILELFRSLHADDGITFVVVTHEERTSSVAGRVIRLEDGNITSDEVADDVTKAPTGRPADATNAGASEEASEEKRARV